MPLSGARIKEENPLRCLICKQGDTERGHASVMLARDGATIVFKNVPADICMTCGEEFIHETVSTELFLSAASAIENGVQIVVRNYLAA